MPAFAGPPTYGTAIVAEVRTVYDGDTFFADIKDWPAIAGQRIGVRIYGIDTPELRGKCPQEVTLARKAKQRVVEILRSAKVVELRNMRRDKYFRIVAEVYADGVNVGERLINSGLAVTYFGKTKVSWCDGE
jgi:endonuclease YncB( thermonuclease family)